MSDAALDEAARQAVSEEVDESVAEEVVEEAVEEEVETEEIEEVEEEDIDEILPQDHKKRSDLGRKVAAVFDRVDSLANIAENQQRTIEILGNKLAPPEPDYEDDEPITKGYLKQVEQQKQQKTAKYETDFKKAFHELADTAEMDEDTKEKVGGILLSNYNVQQSNNGALDGAKAFHSAYKAYNEQKTPLKKKPVTGVVKKQKVKSKSKPLAKLDAQTMSYLKSIERDRGKEVAERMHKELS
jgi:hypothetical protein